MNPFHLAIPVSDLTKAINFYENTLGCLKGRSSELWSDFNFYGHQLVCHKVQQTHGIYSNYVDGEDIPVPHFGIILQWDEFQELSTSLINKNINFIIEPSVRFKGKPGEQAIMFLNDPSGNAIEFKSFKNDEEIFKV
ncbi:VOC family protein [Gammaproteobacteria bacterium]|nr:VOC family protein [Gammaproteobacteria bacterium]MDB4059738.1 VOC family protein [Gammaproteobacteria bacterium]MDB9997235.1 VOC family protein [Gammaproteobacteria bacterium]